LLCDARVSILLLFLRDFQGRGLNGYKVNELPTSRMIYFVDCARLLYVS